MTTPGNPDDGDLIEGSFVGYDDAILTAASMSKQIDELGIDSADMQAVAAAAVGSSPRATMAREYLHLVRQIDEAKDAMLSEITAAELAADGVEGGEA